MRKVERFTDLEVWRKAHSLFLDIFNASKESGSHPAFRVLTNQVIRSTGSIGANISEGHFSSSTREYIRYLNIAKRTTAESENWLYKMRDVGIIDKGKCNGFVGRCIEIQKMLSGLIKSLRRFSAKEKE